MPSVSLSRNSFNQLKRAARQQLPGVQHAHVLEALARALGHNNLAALNARLAVGEDNAVHFFQFSYDDLRIRLAELGYPAAPTWDIDFSGGTEIFRVKRTFPSTLDALLADGIISLEHRQHFDRLIDQRKSILVIGATSSGKSLLMHVLLNEMAVRAPGDDFVVCELTRDGGEYPPNVTRFVKSEHGFDEHEHPHFGDRRVAIDEIRDNTSFRIFQAWAAYGGGVGTMYAKSADEVNARMMHVLNGRGLETIREAIDAVVRMERSGDKPRVAEIVTWGDLHSRSEPPEFSQQWREQGTVRMPNPEDVGRYVLQDLKTIMDERLSSGEQVPFDANVPVIHDDLSAQDAQWDQSGLSFTPQHWAQAADGSWVPASIFGTSHQALHGRQNDVLTQARMDEMSRIVAEGGRVLVIDPKADTNAVNALAEPSGLVTESVVGETAKETRALLRMMDERRLTAPAPRPEPESGSTEGPES
jgi:hypothetical protein